MARGIEEIIEDIEDYIEECKPATFSNSKIVVNRDELEGLLEELRTKTPDEIRKYQKIISNKEAILADAQNKADAIIAQAQITTNELVSEHQIMQQAYEQANEVVSIASKNAEDMLDKATNEANEIKMNAIAYTDQQLKNIQEVIVGTMETTEARMNQYLQTMQGYLDVIVANRESLNPNPTPAPTPAPKVSAKPDTDNKPTNSTEPKEETKSAGSTVSDKEIEEISIDISESFFNKE